MAAELSKRGIPNVLLPENFSDDDILARDKDGLRLCFIQVKACHPDRSKSFILRETDELWQAAPANQFVVLVWLGSPKENEAPRYWIATKKEAGRACINHPAHGTDNWERRFHLPSLPTEWENDWAAFKSYMSGA